MAETLRVEPDLQFIKELSSYGGDTLKKCFQCATCSVVCPLSPDDKPFPRKEMIWAQWGLKDRLAKDPDVWLCHHCGDCTAYCPRGAKPGEVMGALRKASVAYYAPIPIIAKLASTFGGMIALFIVPIVVILGMLAINGKLGLFLAAQVNPETNKIVYSYIFPQLTLVDPTFMCAAIFAVISVFLGVKKFWANISANTTPTGQGMDFVSSIKSTIEEILFHKRFQECGENKKRQTPHMMVFYAFVGLFIVTNSVLVIHWLNHFGFVPFDTPLEWFSPFHPIKFLIKTLANISAVSLLIGMLILIMNRMDAASNGVPSSFFDWSLIIVVTGVAITGIGAEAIRWTGIVKLAYVTYFWHLVFVFYLFAFMPYSKFAHIVYRTVAMIHQKHTGRA